MDSSARSGFGAMVLITALSAVAMVYIYGWTEWPVWTVAALYPPIPVAILQQLLVYLDKPKAARWAAVAAAALFIAASAVVLSYVLFACPDCSASQDQPINASL